MTGSELHLQLSGAVASFRCSSDPVARYAALHLEPLRVAEGAVANVAATLEWHEGPPPHDRLSRLPRLAEMERCDRDLYRRDGSLAWFRIDELPGLELQFEWDGARLSVRGDYYFAMSNSPWRDAVKRSVYWRRVDDLKRRRFTTLLYYLIYYPCFWWLERQRGLHPLHAAGVDVDGDIVVLAGPSGVGKSTLATGLATAPRAKLLSDTFLLHDGTSFHPVREPLLLDDWGRQWLGGEGAALLRPIDWRYCLGRSGFHWPQDRLSDGGIARVLLFPRRATEPSVRLLPAEQAHGQISAGGLLVNDLRRYWAYAAALEALDPSRLVTAREASLAALVADVPCFELGLTAAMKREELCAWVEDLLRQKNVEGMNAAAGRLASAV